MQAKETKQPRPPVVGYEPASEGTFREEVEAGIYEDLDIDAYHDDGAIGSSGINEFNKCPALYYANYIREDRPEKKVSSYITTGSHAHVALLEPEKFNKEYAVAPEYATAYRGKKNEKQVIMNETHADWKEFAKKCGEEKKTPILYSNYLRFCQMAAMIKNHEYANAFLTGGKAEISFFAKDPESGLMIKARPDYLVNVPGLGVYIVDYKTTKTSLDSKKQCGHAFDLNRHIQAAHHKHVVELATESKVDGVCYIVQSQEYPYLVRVFRMPEEYIQIGMEEKQEVLNEMAECKEKDVWPDYEHTIEDYQAPAWFLYKYE